jgi:replication factor C subunit 3/5
MKHNNSIPWVEKYRPMHFENIVLDPLNKTILQNIIKSSFFPNLILFGPPGTGKTTTIINLVKSYQDSLNESASGLMIHLNASDERGIEIIRNQISQFVNSKTLFNRGMKFVILDEVDYMTKNAQQALKYLIQNYSNSVRFCLICNYISKIDEGLQNEFIKLHFNQLPEKDIVKFLQNISTEEKLYIDEKIIYLIVQLYKSDIRSMINFMQCQQDIDNYNFNIIQQNVWETLYTHIQRHESLSTIENYINNTSILYNINKKNIIKDFLNFIIRNKEIIHADFFNFIENIIHFEEYKPTYYINYAVTCLFTFIPEKL